MLPNDTQDTTDEEELAALLLAAYLASLYYGVTVGNSMLNNQVDGAEIDVEAAAAYVATLVIGVNQTTEREVARVVAKWKTEGGDLVEMLDPVFSVSRAEMIAVTETTNAIQSGENIVFNLSEDVTQVEFRTQEDERVCEICGPMEGEILDLDSPDLPPLHPNCRCYTEPVIG